MALSGAILDFDGTLVDSLEAWRDLEGILAQEAQVTVTPEDRAQLTTFTLDETAHWFHDRFGLGKSALAVRKTMDDYMVDYLSHKAQVLPGVAEFLQACVREGVKLTVASSSPQLYLRTALEATGLMPYFLEVLSVEDVGHSKREVHIFDHAREIMATPKGSTWGFDDSLYALRVLRDAGYPTVGIYDPSEGRSFDEWGDFATIAARGFDDLSLEDFDR